MLLLLRQEGLWEELHWSQSVGDYYAAEKRKAMGGNQVEADLSGRAAVLAPAFAIREHGEEALRKLGSVLSTKRKPYFEKEDHNLRLSLSRIGGYQAEFDLFHNLLVTCLMVLGNAVDSS